METGSTAALTWTTFRNQASYPFCPGCGHRLVLDHLNDALVRLQIDPHRVVFVSDIGCAGLSDQYFGVHAFHGLHGRSLAYATGIKLMRPDLKVIVVLGDGGCGIGGAHLINAARRNIGITTVVFNNFNFGMTGGQHSVTTPPGGLTPTTRDGNLERPMDICGTVAVNGASLVYRGTAFDPGLAERLAEAIALEGFSLFDIRELCTAHYVTNNRFSSAVLMAKLNELHLPVGLVHRESRDEYVAAYRQHTQGRRGEAALSVQVIDPDQSAPLKRKLHVILAGSAGDKVRSAARLIGIAASCAGLYASQKDDYPTTVMSGHSVSEVILSPSEIYYSGIRKADAVILLSRDGYKRITPHIAHLTADDWLFTVSEFVELQTLARRIVFDFEAAGVRPNKKTSGLLVILAALRILDPFSIQAMEVAIRKTSKAAFLEEQLSALAQSEALAEQGLSRFRHEQRTNPEAK